MFASFTIISVLMVSYKVRIDNTISFEKIAVFKLNYGDQPGFLDEVEPDKYIFNGSMPIHEAHHQGKPHMGAWIHILDR